MTSVAATLDDSTLIKLTLAGHVEAFAALMDRHKTAVRRRIFAMVRNTDDTDDLLQEVQLRVWRHLSAFRSESTFRTWIIRVAINEVLQSYRREKRRGVCQPLQPIHTRIRECHTRVAPIEIAVQLYNLKVDPAVLVGVVPYRLLRQLPGQP